MSVWSNLMERATGVRVRNGFERVPLTVNLQHRNRPNYASYSEEHELELRVTATYRLDNTLRDDSERGARARNAALMHIRHTLYGDLLGVQTELMHAIADGDQDQALTLCAKLRQEILG